MYRYSCTTTYTYDKSNQLVSSTTDGKVTHYAYDATGRLIKEGDKSYSYGWLDKVLCVTENGKQIARFNYHNDGQIAQAIHNGRSEDFLWDGLALIHRGETSFINEPYVTGGNPVMAGDDVLFNDMLGSTLAINGKAVEMTSFGETADKNAFFTGKPMIDELGYSFLFRDYNPNQDKWTTSDPLGYPDGWNNLAYGNNNTFSGIDAQGAEWIYITHSMTFSTSTITVNAHTNNSYEEVIYTGLKNGGNRGVAVLGSATYANFRAQFAENISVPSSIISDEWYNVSLGTRINIIMTGWNDGGSADNPAHIYGTDGTPTKYYFKLYSVTGYARYTFTYQTGIWE